MTEKSPLLQQTHYINMHGSGRDNPGTMQEKEKTEPLCRYPENPFSACRHIFCLAEKFFCRKRHFRIKKEQKNKNEIFMQKNCIFLKT